ncbi:hypothetical protein Agub_g782 [Astrephomene gubernaculifera]|uniref:Uncharacterized protein n=1 Tax=Astrephomene gubernaculifera TaxID=47775 RepID=A0AAD3DHS2_9CHLO|nr:hypothetical protein Agub_g782 [Astrephomene gubernaculifera]
MLVGGGKAGSSSFRPHLSEACGTKLGLDAETCYDRSSEHVILSKSSLTPDCGFTCSNNISDYFGRDFSAECARARTSPSLCGEPATPNGTGDSISSQSPVSNSHSCYGQGHAPLDPLMEESSHCFSTQRRWYGNSCDGADSYAEDARHGAHTSAARHRRFPSAQNGDGLGYDTAFPFATGIGSSNPNVGLTPNDDLNAQLSFANARVEVLEHELRDQRALNEGLALQLQQRDAQLYELRRLQGAHGDCARQDPEANASSAGPSSLPQMGLLSRLHRSREELFPQPQEPQQPQRHATDEEASEQLPAAGVPHPATLFPLGCPYETPSPPSTPAPPHLAAHPEPEAPWPLEAVSERSLALLRLDTPQAFDTMAPPAADLVSGAGGSAGAAESATATAPLAPLLPQHPRHRPQQAMSSPFLAVATAAAASEPNPDHHDRRAHKQDHQDKEQQQHLPQPPEIDSDVEQTKPTPSAPSAPTISPFAAASSTAAAAMSDSVTPAHADALSSASDLHPLLAQERRRTDRAHAALLVSSRQAQRLSHQVAALQVRQEALLQELKDWRSACLENHRKLARLRRAAAEAVEAGGSGVGGRRAE